MKHRASIAALTLAAFGTTAAGAFAQALVQDTSGTPSVANGALIPPGLIIWLLPIAAILSAGLFAFVDRKMRSGKTAV